MLAIEEPELYLHPHGCRHFFGLLQELSKEGLQIIYTTHERSFVDAGEFEQIHIVRRPEGATEITSGLSLPFSQPRERLRIQSRFNDSLNEMFFARCVILVEGYADEVACRCALLSREIELDRESVSIVSLGGKNELPIVAELLHGFRIPTIVLMDEDPGNASTAATHEDVKKFIGAENLFLCTPKLEGVFGLSKKPNRVEAISVFPDWFSQNPAPEIYGKLAAHVRSLLS